MKRFLDVLVSAKMVSVQSAGVTSIITILNWNKYQTLSHEWSVQKDSWARINRLTDNKINNIKEKKSNLKTELLNIKKLLKTE